ncbi:N-acyl-L-homoserine lactone synthetase [Pseudomonas protegens]|uniref:acyl-homoserine-lactone synthase n=1 Tax=Pseudomonas TaxID=286 RepID=UPI0008C85037|nr:MULTISPECIES: acyl-homoserine-lactone synthase [Pseudomonas]BCQ60547.1 acyl-homoserine-lactone synthase [Pseudomonas sp. Boi14]GED78641.1 acyl-homoserine-lactone synthase [Pseudomonas fluorescens]AQT08649.1 autoinducer synthesis protein RhlI [Pseudomonas protegens]MCS4260420.1 N-acyl-L-homoserine lactone synthetase [Pseudomonas sp. BIGb0176]MDF4210897.1 acyl-homoserine-lactone synthase [Pseudomonas protegens]
MRIFSGNGKALGSQLKQDIASYRYKVFVEKLGWPLDCPDQLELDEFDRDDTLYLAAKDETGAIVGTARLLPTTRPYLLSEVFPDLLGSDQPPSQTHVWELSRFAAVSLDKETDVLNAYSSSHSMSLLLEAFEYAKSLGARKLLTVSPSAIARLLIKRKFNIRRLGPSRLSEGLSIMALEIDLSAARSH